MSIPDLQLAQVEAVREMRIVGHDLLSSTQNEDADLLGHVTDALLTLKSAEKRLRWVAEETHFEQTGFRT